jgi:hypothetical protein
LHFVFPPQDGIHLIDWLPVPLQCLAPLSQLLRGTLALLGPCPTRIEMLDALALPKHVVIVVNGQVLDAMESGLDVAALNIGDKFLKRYLTLLAQVAVDGVLDQCAEDFQGWFVEGVGHGCYRERLDR